MNKFRALIILSFAVILAFAVIGCSASPGSLLLGKWEEVKDKKQGKPDVIEFLKDGTLLLGEQSLKYRVIDETRLELGGSGIITYKVSKEELTMVIEGRKLNLRRLRT